MKEMVFVGWGMQEMMRITKIWRSAHECSYIYKPVSKTCFISLGTPSFFAKAEIKTKIADFRIWNYNQKYKFYSCVILPWAP